MVTCIYILCTWKDEAKRTMNLRLVCCEFQATQAYSVGPCLKEKEKAVVGGRDWHTLPRSQTAIVSQSLTELLSSDGNFFLGIRPNEVKGKA